MTSQSVPESYWLHMASWKKNCVLTLQILVFNVQSHTEASDSSSAAPIEWTTVISSSYVL